MENDRVTKKLAKLLTENDLMKTKLAELHKTIADKESNEQSQK